MVIKNQRKKGTKKTKKSSISDASEAALSKNLQDEGFLIVRMAGDGNCMFRSLGHQLYQDPNQHIQIRQTIMDYVASMEDHFVMFIEDDETFDDYVERMRQFGEWGDHTELYASAQCFKVDIIIHQADAPTYVIFGSNGAGNAIHLSYHGSCHYNSVTRINSNANSDPISLSSIARSSDSDMQQSSIDKVARALPWVEDEAITQALRKANMNVDAAIEMLCSGIEEISVLYDDCQPAVLEVPKLSEGKAASDQSTSCTKESVVGTNKKLSKEVAKIKKVKINLSKKEQRKLEKQASNGKNVSSKVVEPTQSSYTSASHPSIIAI